MLFWGKNCPYLFPSTVAHVTGKKYTLSSSSLNYARLTSVVTSRYSTVFGVKTCESARVVISEVAGVLNFNAYEFIIGAESNTAVQIKYLVDGDTVK